MKSSHNDYVIPAHTIPESPSPKSGGTPRRWLVAGMALAVLIAVMYAAVFALASRIKAPALTSLAALDLATVDRVELLVINRPDGQPDTSAGKTEMVPVPMVDAATLIDTLRPAVPVNAARGIWMGKLIVHLKDGRKVETLIYSVNEKGPGPLRYKIEEYQYELPSAATFLSVVDRIDLKIKSEK
jgi:hypothetical protein